MIVYCALNLINGKRYVGITVRSLHARIVGHRYAKSPLGKAIRKYGESAFKFEVIDCAEDRATLGRKERWWIAYFECMQPNGYNLTSGGEIAFFCSDETRAKISKARTGKHQSPETIAKQKASNAGFKHTKEAKEKIRLAKLGKPRSAETCRKMSEGMRGRKPSPETIAKQVASNAGRKLSPEHIKKVVQFHLGRKRSEEARDRMRQAWKGTTAQIEALKKGRTKNLTPNRRAALDRGRLSRWISSRDLPPER